MRVAAIASTNPTGCTRSHDPDRTVVSTLAPHAPATATTASAALAIPCAAPASANASSDDSE